MKNRHLLFGFAFVAIGAIGFFATSASAISFKIENGITDVGVTPLADTQSASDYYKYDVIGFSGNPDSFPEANTAFCWLYEDTNSGNISLGMIFNEDGGGGLGRFHFSMTGVPSIAFFELQDDPFDQFAIAGDTWDIRFGWKNNTDGLVIGGLHEFTPSDEITILLTYTLGIDEWYFLTGDADNPDRILLDMTLPLIIYDPPTDAQPTPTPEPSTMLLLGTGLIGLSAFGRRIRK